jgi:hypothetical protein
MADAGSAPAASDFEIDTEGQFNARRLLEAVTEMAESSAEPHWRAFTATCGEIAKLVASMGSVFHFAAADVRHNVGVMCKQFAKLHKEAEGDKSVQLTLPFIIDRELKAGTEKSDNRTYIAITFTARHLLWTLDFVEAILRRLTSEEASDKAKELVQIVRESYMETLRQYHGMIFATTITTACGMLPARDAFLGLIADGMAKGDLLATLVDANKRLATQKEAVWEVYRSRKIVKE